MIKFRFFALAILISAPLLAVVEPIEVDDSLVGQLQIFHTETGSSGSNKPELFKYAKEKRKFFAKMDSFGMDRWFSFENQEDVNKLVKGVQSGGAMWVHWYCYDASEGESLATVSSLPGFPNATVISYDQEQ